LAAPILSNLRIVLVKFDANKMTPELEGDLSASGRAAKWIKNDASTDRWQIGFPSNGYGLPRNVLPPGILPTRLGAGSSSGLVYLPMPRLNGRASS
jgi:hypothetical protein